MPKVLQCSKEKMLDIARSILIEKGYDACTMREVASACGVSVGTVYTYFESKNALVVHAVAADWFEVLEDAKKKCGSLDEAVDALAQFYDSMKRHAMKYKSVFLHLSASGTDDVHYRKGAHLLLEQVRSTVSYILAPTQRGDDAALQDFLATMLLTYAQKAVAGVDGCDFSQFRPYIVKLLQ